MGGFADGEDWRGRGRGRAEGGASVECSVPGKLMCLSRAAAIWSKYLASALWTAPAAFIFRGMLHSMWERTSVIADVTRHTSALPPSSRRTAANSARCEESVASSKCSRATESQPLLASVKFSLTPTVNVWYAPACKACN